MSSLHGSERKSTPDVRTGKSSVGPEATVKETEVESEKTQARNPGILIQHLSQKHLKMFRTKTLLHFY